MNQKELPEWSLPYFSENYTGPFLSDGKFQASVANGRAPPKSRLDRLSRAHDTAYFLAKNDADRRKADRIYHKATRDMSLVPRFAGDLVLHWNDPMQLFGPDGLVGFDLLYSELGLGAIARKMGLQQSLQNNLHKNAQAVTKKYNDASAAGKNAVKSVPNVRVDPTVPEGSGEPRSAPSGTTFVQSGETPQSASTDTMVGIGSGQVPPPSTTTAGGVVYDPNRRASQYDDEYGGVAFAYRPNMMAAQANLRNYDSFWPRRIGRKRNRRIRVYPSIC